MESVYEISYALGTSRDDLPHIDSVERGRIHTAIETKLQFAPDRFGKPLRWPLAGYWSLHIGSYRIIYRINKMKVVILAVFHRSRGYDTLAKLISRREEPFK